MATDYTDSRVGYPFGIGDTEAQVVQDLAATGSPSKPHFDNPSDLWVRQARYTSTASAQVVITRKGIFTPATSR